MTIVYVDTIIFDLQNAGGISVYWYEIIKRMLNDKTVDPYFIVSNKSKDNLYWEKLQLPQNKIIKYDKPFNRYRNVNYREVKKHVFLSSYYRVSNNRNAINVTIVHDFTYEYFSSGLRKFVHHKQKMSAISKSKKIICISQNTQKDLLKFAKHSVDSTVVYNGVSDIFRLMSDEEMGKALQTFEPAIADVISNKKYVLYVGQRVGYKNWVAAIKVFKLLPKEYLMISVGGNELSKEEKDLLGEDIERHYKLEPVTEEKLCLLYNKAYCLLYLSLYEGFGIPVVEAEQCGCPVMAMNRSSITELAKGSDLIMLVNEIEPLPLNLVHKHVEVRFSWDKTYEGIKAIGITPYADY